MRLLNFKVTNYRCVEESGLVEVDEKITCLVGKNESGKTTLLQAIQRLNSITPTNFDETDYPSKGYIAYKARLKNGEPPAIVATAMFSIEADDIKEVVKVAGNCVASGAHLSLTVDYAMNVRPSFKDDEEACVRGLTESAALSEETLKAVKPCTTLKALEAELGKATGDAKAVEMLAKVRPIAAAGLQSFVWNQVLKNRLPKFMYFDDYYIMSGNAPLDTLQNDEALKQPAHAKFKTLRDLLDLAGVRPNDLKQSANYEHHYRLLRAIANDISASAFKYWSQNKELQVLFSVQGTDQTLHIRILNQRHGAEVDFDERSKGFVWFFSFLAAFRKITVENKKLVILLDEPGLNLHASAQSDLLRFIEEELAKAGHQIVYSTHSPFMIDPHKLDRVRTVEDKIDGGTKASRNWASVDAATAFPLQAALGYDIAQTLFVGPNCLAVEGPSDMLYLQSMSELLEREKRTPLDLDRWTITPVGGAGKLSTFVALLGSNEKLNIVVLMDYKKADDTYIEDVLNTGRLDKNKLILYSHFTGTKEADVEDMFDVPTYLEFVKKAYPIASDIDEKKIGKQPRLVKRVEEFLEGKPTLKGPFHFKPSQAAVELLAGKVKPDKATLDRFEKLFKQLNKLLPK